MGWPRMVGVIVCVVVALAGLTSCGKFYWNQPHASQQEFDRDNRECAKESAPTEAAAAYGIVYETLYRACLSTRGWKREQHVGTPPPGWYRGIE